MQQNKDVCSEALQKLSEDKAQVELEREALFKKQNLQAKFSSKVCTMRVVNCSLVLLPFLSWALQNFRGALSGTLCGCTAYQPP